MIHCLRYFINFLRLKQKGRLNYFRIYEFYLHQSHWWLYNSMLPLTIFFDVRWYNKCLPLKSSLTYRVVLNFQCWIVVQEIRYFCIHRRIQLPTSRNVVLKSINIGISRFFFLNINSYLATSTKALTSILFILFTQFSVIAFLVDKIVQRDGCNVFQKTFELLFFSGASLVNNSADDKYL